jgi:pimeloyl-ACP methyl ester carboxylesterase
MALHRYSSFTPLHRGGSGPPLVCVHGFMDTWRTWELVLPALERRHELLAPTLLGHAGGPPLEGELTDTAMVETIERQMDEAGFETAHVVGNSLGGFLALQLAERGRARTVVALAPAGGWAEDDDSYKDLLRHQRETQELARAASPFIEAILATREGRRRVTAYITTSFDHIPTELLAHLVLGVAGCSGLGPMIDYALREKWLLDPEKIACPVRIVWGTDDRVLPWPQAAARFRRDWLPQADWVVLDGVGHCLQLDVPLETAELILGFSVEA